MEVNQIPLQFQIAYNILTFYKDVSVILGGETDGIFEGSLTTVETYSPKCGLFDNNLPPMPKGRKSFGAAYLDGYIYSMLLKHSATNTSIIPKATYYLVILILLQHVVVTLCFWRSKNVTD